MKLKIFGPNLRDQSKGQFVIHAADCADCKKLEKIGEHFCIETHDKELSVSKSIWSDIINEGSMTAEDGLMEIHFAPCVKFKPTTATIPPCFLGVAFFAGAAAATGSSGAAANQI